jgi:hypothetical protein
VIRSKARTGTTIDAIRSDISHQLGRFERLQSAIGHRLNTRASFAMAGPMAVGGYPLNPNMRAERGGAVTYMRLMARAITPCARAALSIATSQRPRRS